ncbi:hypothetical protein A0H81_02828 [Grifola frondosa]|uniref:Uncharacterized protein n=1 Tax=Grifola frondosa TaxID=5627 RepID=A0A1C7MK81_GRIFR|nr:hypothetical protein A0H81_02828 [Grifola frondosa]
MPGVRNGAESLRTSIPRASSQRAVTPRSVAALALPLHCRPQHHPRAAVRAAARVLGEEPLLRLRGASRPFLQPSALALSR